jgi:CDP-paratose 2-epimerase
LNLGGGAANAVSLNQLIAHIEHVLGRDIAVSHAPWRIGDQRYYVSDTRRATEELQLRPPLPWQSGVARLLHWLANEATPDPSWRDEVRGLAVGAHP